jgi:hypothetical protein
MTTLAFQAPAPELHKPLRVPGQPLIVNLGLGVDSVAMLVGLKRLGERPDLIIFADTGGEKPETLAYLAVLNAWLMSIGFPTVTVVTRPIGRANYRTLEENCLRNETLPSLAFNLKGCSQKWKGEAMDAALLGRKRGKNKRPPMPFMAAAIAAGVKAVKLIGYDAGPKDMRRGKKSRTEDKFFLYRYPLREWGWDRERCEAEIRAEGLPVPVKSACFFCPASQPWELYWLAAVHPELFVRAVVMEDTARAGRHGLTKIAGLWGRDSAPTKRKPEGHTGSWRRWAENKGILRGTEVVMPAVDLLAHAERLKAAKSARPPCALAA